MNMSIPKGLAALGVPMQIAFVPADFDGTLRFWVETMGVGPFYVIEGTRAQALTHRGVASDPELTVALAYWGDIQVEIIRQDNEAPSIYREWREAGGEGVHHLCVEVRDLDAAKALCREAGVETLLDASGTGARWMYVDTGGGPGTILEIIQHSEQSGGMMQMIRDAGKDWDGSEPVRWMRL